MLNLSKPRSGVRVKKLASLLSLGLMLLASPRQSMAVSPTAAGFMSVVPGLGQVAEGRPWVGLGYLSALAGLVGASNLTSGDAKVILGASIPSFYCYQMYAAYRDGEPKSHMYGDSNVFEDYVAAFNPLNAIDLKVLAFDSVAAVQGATHGLGGSYSPLELLYFGVAVQQEEALYRGFLYPVFTDWYGGPTSRAAKIGAAVTTSLLDSAQHALYLPDALNPTIFTLRTVMFLYLTWMYDRNNYHLPKNIFAHAWFDYLLRSPVAGTSFGGGRPFTLGTVDGAVAGVKIFF